MIERRRKSGIYEEGEEGRNGEREKERDRERERDGQREKKKERKRGIGFCSRNTSLLEPFTESPVIKKPRSISSMGALCGSVYVRFGARAQRRHRGGGRGCEGPRGTASARRTPETIMRASREHKARPGGSL